MKSNFKFLYIAVSPYRKLWLLLVALALLTSIFDGLSIGMLVPLLSSLQSDNDVERLPRLLSYIVRFFEDFSPDRRIFYVVLFIVLSVLVKNLLLAATVTLRSWISTKLSADLRGQAIDLLMEVDIGFFNDTRVGAILEKINSNTRKIERVFSQLTNLVLGFCTLIVLLILLMVLSWKLSLITLFFGFATGYGIARFIKFIAQLAKATARSDRNLSADITEAVTGIHLIKFFSKENIHGTLLKRKVESNRKLRFRLNLSNGLIQVMTEGLGILALGIIFTIATLKYNLVDELLIPQLLPFMYVLTRLIPVIKEINKARGEITTSWPFLAMVEELLNRENKPTIVDGQFLFTGLVSGIKFCDLTFSYDATRKPALNSVRFIIPKGKTTALVGESGAGKSTIINLLLRLYDPQQGGILIDDRPLKDIQIKSFRGAIGLVSQDTYIFNDTAFNNIAYGALFQPSNEAVIAAAQRASAHEFIMELPNGYDTLLGDRGIRLSGGQRQRISIARAILRDPEILILDEATSSLDNKVERLIHRAISKLSQNRTVVIIAHRLSTIKNADKIIVLKNGRVIEVGKENELLDEEGEYFRLLNIDR